MMESVAPFGTTSPKVEPSVVSPSWICAAKWSVGRWELAVAAAAVGVFVVWERKVLDCGVDVGGGGGALISNRGHVPLAGRSPTLLRVWCMSGLQRSGE